MGRACLKNDGTGKSKGIQWKVDDHKKKGWKTEQEKIKFGGEKTNRGGWKIERRGKKRTQTSPGDRCGTRESKTPQKGNLTEKKPKTKHVPRSKKGVNRPGPWKGVTE